MNLLSLSLILALSLSLSIDYFHSYKCRLPPQEGCAQIETFVNIGSELCVCVSAAAEPV